MKTLLRLALAIAVTAVALPALAQTFEVRATVAPSCRIITPSDLDFSAGGTVNYDMNDPTPLDASTTVTFRCSRNTDYQIGIDGGLHAGLGGAGARAMQDPVTSDYLGYDLYFDAGRTQLWANAAPNWLTGNSGATAGVQTATIYGRIPIGQDVSPTGVGGAYVDATVTITINY
jgi:spore coat protein U-like protein